MLFIGTINVDLEPVYVNLGNRLGAYVVEPGEAPLIALHESLKINNTPLTQVVYQALVEFHNSLPEVYRLFPLTRWYEDLPQTQPVEQIGPEHSLEVEPEIEIIGRSGRRWKYALLEAEISNKIRLVS